MATDTEQANTSMASNSSANILNGMIFDNYSHMRPTNIGSFFEVIEVDENGNESVPLEFVLVNVWNNLTFTGHAHIEGLKNATFLTTTQADLA